MTREDCYSALFALAQTTVGIVTSDRKLELLDDVPAGIMPALYMTVSDQQARPRTGLPRHTLLTALVYVYASNPQPTVSAGVALNTLIDAFTAAIAPPPYLENQTLGGLVHYCRIEGMIAVYEAPKGQKAAAVIPVHMMVPDL